MDRCYTTENLGDGLVLLASAEHRFGTDAFLLSHFAEAKHKDKCVDLGTGCGIIPMLLYKKFRPSLVWGVDIQPEAIEQFTQAIGLSHVEETLFPLCSDMKELKGKLPFDHFDLVTCNPPYFGNGNGFLSAVPAHICTQCRLVIGDYSQKK